MEYQHLVILCRKAVYTNDVSVRRYLDETSAENVKKPMQKISYEKLDLGSRPISNKDSYQSLQFDHSNNGSPGRPIKSFDFSSESNSSVATLEPSQLPPFEKNFYKLHLDTKNFSDVSKTHLHVLFVL